MDPLALKALTDLISPAVTHATGRITKRGEGGGDVSRTLVSSLTAKFVRVLEEADVADIARRMTEREHAVKLRKQLNLEECLRLAVEVALDQPPKNTRELQEDWFFQWFACAENVSDEFVQEMWARVLSQTLNAEKPAVSLRALDTLRLMQREDAAALREFSGICNVIGPLVVSHWSVIDSTVGHANLDVLLDLGLASREIHALKNIALPDAFALYWSPREGRVALDQILSYRPTARGAELARTLPDPAPLENPVQFAAFDYARLFAAGLGSEYDVALRFNRGRFRDPNSAVGQRSKDMVETHRWNSDRQEWGRSPELTSELLEDLPKGKLQAIEGHPQ